MEIRYIRKLMTSHMVIEQMEVPCEWETQMIAHASLKEVLFAEYICEDGRNDLWYDITGKQSLDVLLGDTMLDYELLCRILMGIYAAAEGVEGILLRAENLLLQPESIFFDYNLEQIYLCYCPGNAQPVSGTFLQLMEYLLTKLNHEDAKAVELAYGIYDRAAKSEWSLREIQSVVRLSYQAEEVAEEIVEMSEIEEHIEQKEENEKVSQKLPAARDWKSYVARLKKALWERVQKRFANCHISGKPPKEEERFLFEPEPEEKENVSRPTVLLAALTKPPEGILRYEGNGPCSNLVIAGEEYLIGSDDACTGYIPSETVSRRHAKITRVDDIYFVEDLNSSNGTYVGGELLNYKTKVSLHKNEIIIFADEKFRFI